MLKLLLRGERKEKMMLKAFLQVRIWGTSWRSYSSKLLVINTVSSVSIMSLMSDT